MLIHVAPGKETKNLPVCSCLPVLNSLCSTPNTWALSFTKPNGLLKFLPHLLLQHGPWTLLFLKAMMFTPLSLIQLPPQSWPFRQPLPIALPAGGSTSWRIWSTASHLLKLASATKASFPFTKPFTTLMPDSSKSPRRTRSVSRLSQTHSLTTEKRPPVSAKMRYQSSRCWIPWVTWCLEIKAIIGDR